MPSTFISLALWLGVTLARPSQFIPRALGASSIQLAQNTTSKSVTTLTLDEVHENVLASWPGNLTLTKDRLDQYLRDRRGEPVLVYVEDTRQWVRTIDSDTNKNNDTLGPRLLCGDSTINYKTLASQSYWGAWVPISSCYDNTDNPEENSQSLSYSDSWSTSYSFGVSVGGSGAPNIVTQASDLVKDLVSTISLSFGVSYTDSYTVSNTYSCAAPPNGQSQIWSQHQYGWNAIEMEYTNCGAVVAVEYGWAASPISSSSTIGCSANTYVDCNNS